MKNGRIFGTIALLVTSAGCSQPGPITSHFSNVRGLKSSVSQLQFQNESLQKKVADLDAKNRDLGDRLVQEESARDELASNLDNARNELRRRGIAVGDESERDDFDSPKTLPAGRSNQKKKKTPFAQIPARIEEIPPSDSSGNEPATGPRASKKGERLEFGPQSSRLEPDGPWQPIAGATRTGIDVIR